MIRRCAAAGLEEPEFAVTDGFVATIRRSMEPDFWGKAMGQADIQGGLGRDQVGAKPGHAGPSQGQAHGKGDQAEVQEGQA